MRAHHKSWQSDRPLKRDSRRVRWFQGNVGGQLSIRLNFEDGDGSCNRFYTSKEEANAEYEAFIAGELSVRELMVD